MNVSQVRAGLIEEGVELTDITSALVSESNDNSVASDISSTDRSLSCCCSNYYPSCLSFCLSVCLFQSVARFACLSVFLCLSVCMRWT